MAKKIINSGKIYIDEALLKASRPITQKDTRGADRKFYEIDLSAANTAGASIYTADGTISDFQRNIDLNAGNTIVLSHDFAPYGKTLLELRNESDQHHSLAFTQYSGGAYQRGLTLSSKNLSVGGSGGAGTSSDNRFFDFVNFYTGVASGFSYENYSGGNRKVMFFSGNALTYDDDYSADFVDRTLPDIAWVNSYTDQIRRKVVEIGDWDMDANQTTTVAHGLTFSKIRNVEGVIRNDADTIFYSSGYIGASGNVQWTTTTIDATNVTLTRRPGGGGGVFDDPAFSTTPFNRGWLIIDYVD